MRSKYFEEPIMAGTSKEKELAQCVYTALQSLSCPLVDGPYLSEAESMLELLCTSLQRIDILKWICVRISPSLAMKFSSLKSTDIEAVIQEIALFGHEMMLCKADDLDLIKGQVSALRQLHFLEQLIAIVPGKENVVSKQFLEEIFSSENLPHLQHMLNPFINPWPAEMWCNPGHLKTAKSHTRVHRSELSTPNAESVARLSTLLQTTQNTLEELHRECLFLQGEALSNASPLSPCLLRVEISDLSQLMSAFCQLFNTGFRMYCQRALLGSCVFQNVHQLLVTCSRELQALQDLMEASQALADSVRQLQTNRQYWYSGEKCALSVQLEDLMKIYKELFLQNR